MNRTQALCKAFGWQGGTIHQVSEETGCDVSAILNHKPTNTYLGSVFSNGWFAGRTCSIEHNKSVNFPKYRGNIDFWIGVAEGIIEKNS